jgi:hypothetical protein
LGLPIHAGGKTALQLQGYAHFLPLGKDATVFLFGPPGIKLPAWFTQYRWGVKVRFTATRLFADEENGGLTTRETGAFSIGVSAPERAMMEALYFVPKEQSYEEARLLMEVLTTLRHRVVQSLLERCTSVKVKRLFMVLAEASGHAWVKKLDVSKVDFGTGNRMLVRGGRLDPKYHISVPETGAGLGASGRRA